MRTRTLRISVFWGMLLLNVPQIHAQQRHDYDFNDAHVHVTNNVQDGPSVREFLKMMGTKVGRAALFGIPLQQQWSYRVDGDRAPTYYLHSDAPLYYYSFTDAWIAMAYKSLPPDAQARFDPMITGFNPTDMYAVDHIRRVLRTFPGVFTGIGEFTIHKEYVSGKIPGEVASLQNPALDRILDFAAEAGLLVLIHSDIDVPFAKEGSEPAYFLQTRALFARHPKATIIWAHMGLGRTVRPPRDHIQLIEEMLRDPGLQHVNFDISWTEVAKYIVATPESLRRMAALLQRYPDRFLFGTDVAAPRDQSQYLGAFHEYEPLWKTLDAEASRKIRLENYERIFGEARNRVRAWERANAREP